MAKYTNMAGFKGVSEEDAEETSEKLPRPLSFLIIGGVAVVIIVAFLIVHAFSSNHGGTATSDEAATVAAATEDYDYNKLFGLEETTVPSEPITLKPQSSSPSMTIAVPQPITQPVTMLRRKVKQSQEQNRRWQEANPQRRSKVIPTARRAHSRHSKAARRKVIRFRSRR